MTTIAYKDGVLAADGRETIDGAIFNESAIKIANLGNGLYFAGSGDSDDRAIREILGSGQIPSVEDLREIKQEHYGILADAKANKLYYVAADDKACAINDIPIDRPFATGSGGVYALGAMLAGASAKEAVQAAKKIDVNSGGKVRCVQLWEG